MKTIRIFTGDEITTMDGHIIIKSNNGSGLIYCESYINLYDEDLNFIGCSEPEKAVYTLSEIDSLMREIDGLNHKVVWDYDRQDD